MMLLCFSILAGHAIGQQSEGIGSGEMQWFDSTGSHHELAVTQSTDLDIEITGMVAVVSIEQRFENNTGEWREGVYSFPLPSDAAVRHLEMQVGERVIVGRIREREEAARVYEQAKAEGKKASLVAQQRPNMFTNRIANIGPGENVTVRLEYIQQAHYRDGEFTLTIPTTMTPRYIPGQILLANQQGSAGGDQEIPVNVQLQQPLAVDASLGWALPTDQVPDANAVSPFLHSRAGNDNAPLNPLRFELTLNAGMPLAKVEALYHETVLKRKGEAYHMTLAHKVAEMNRDLVLHWQPVSGSAPRAAFFSEKVDGEYYGLLMVLPPSLATEAEVLPREIVFVIDTSGSMGGVSIEQARQGLSLALDQLRPQDTFNVIAFNSVTQALFWKFLPANSDNLARAHRFVDSLNASGGTEMMAALELALRADVPEDGVKRLRQVIFITDGAVSNEEALFRAIEKNLGESRLFTVGIGSAPNQWFMQRAAEVGRGSSVQIARLDEVNTRMVRLFERISSPLAADIVTRWPQNVEAWPRRIPDLYRGEPLVQALHFGQLPPAGVIEVSGELAGQTWTQNVTIAPADYPQRGVASLWARRKITSLLGERNHSLSEDEVRSEVLKVALPHQLLSPYTSFVAVDEAVSREPKNDVLLSSPVPNTRPQGQSHQSYAYPNGATTGLAKAFFGCFALFVALLFHVMRRPEQDHVATSV
ncbi:MAG: marine proteobacterial sortase target protein [Parahaliea sp.]